MPFKAATGIATLAIQRQDILSPIFDAREFCAGW